MKFNHRTLLAGKSKTYISVDGTDCPIQEPHPHDPSFFSFKIKAAALRYEVDVAVHTGFIVWVSGPYPAGTPDITIFRDGLEQALLPTEKVVADKGYQGEECIQTPGSGSLFRNKQQQKIRSRQENVNRRLNIFKCLYNTSRHDNGKHEYMFFSVAVIVQIDFLPNGCLYDIDYYF